MSFDSYFLTFEWGSTLTLSNSKKLESHLYNTVICLEGRLPIKPFVYKDKSAKSRSKKTIFFGGLSLRTIIIR